MGTTTTLRAARVHFVRGSAAGPFAGMYLLYVTVAKAGSQYLEYDTTIS